LERTDGQMEKLKRMKLGIFEGLLALLLVVVGALSLAIAIRRMLREKASPE